MELDRDTSATLEYSRKILNGKVMFSIEGLRSNQISARCIEVPWAASKLAKCDPSTILDVGISLASLDFLGVLLDLKVTMGKQLEAIDIVKPQRVESRYPIAWRKEILSIPVYTGDLTNLKLPEERYDAVTCISTIEHIGYDVPARNNRHSAFVRARRKEDVALDRPADTNVRVLKNIHAALKDNGLLILTAPMGKGGPVILQDSLGYYCAQWEYEKESWQEIVTYQGFRLAEQSFFKLSNEDQWVQVDSVGDLSTQEASVGSHSNGCALAVLQKIGNTVDSDIRAFK